MLLLFLYSKSKLSSTYVYKALTIKLLTLLRSFLAKTSNLDLRFLGNVREILIFTSLLIIKSPHFVL